MKNIKRGIFMLAMIFALLCSAQPVDAPNKTYVVVVGVDNQNTLFGVPAATAKRAAKFYRHTQNAEVFLLLEKNATRDNILRVMRNMFSRADNQDAIVFVYDGHGYCTSSWAAGGITTIGELQAVKEMGIPLTTAVAAVTHNPSRILGIQSERGFLQEGCYADMVLLDQDLTIRKIWKEGRAVSS